jgi:hypothetical protein
MAVFEPPIFCGDLMSTKEEIKSEAIGYFVLGMILVIAGFVLYSIMLPPITFPLPSNYIDLMMQASLVMIVCSGLGGLVNLLGLIKLIDYYKMD